MVVSQYQIVPVFPSNSYATLPRRKYKKNCNLLYYYFKDNKTHETVLRVPIRFIVYECEKDYIIDSTIDLKKTKLPKGERKKFFEILKRVRLIQQHNITCNDYPFLVKYRALCEFYDFPLMKKKIKCRKDNKLMMIEV